MGIQFQNLSRATSPGTAARVMIGALGWDGAKNLALKMRDEAANEVERYWVEDVIDEMEFSRAIRNAMTQEGSGR
jgi:hypothetical protein